MGQSDDSLVVGNCLKELGGESILEILEGQPKHDIISRHSKPSILQSRAMI
jgi:hypothetical protein